VASVFQVYLVCISWSDSFGRGDGRAEKA
jgi:hypothetical protein